MALAFLGKWTLGQDANAVQFDATTGLLSAGAVPGDGSDRFNAYGTPSGFVLQAANGKYVVAAGGGYAATAAVGGALKLFTLVASGSDFAILDLGVGGSGANQYFWNVSGTALGQTPKVATPPASALFVQTVITPGIADILANGFSVGQPDLTWVNVSGTDFSQAQSTLDFTQTTLTNADFSHTNFEDNTGFDGSTARGACFAFARLPGCSLGTIDFTGADFTSAHMKDCSFDNSIFDGATLTDAKLNTCNNLAKARFIGAHAQRIDLSNCANIVDTDFTDADLTGAIFTGSSVTGTMTLNGANLTDAQLNNPATSITIYPGFLVIDAHTNFTGTNLQYIDFDGYTLVGQVMTGADLTGCSFVGCDMRNAELSYATLDNTKLTGTVKLNGANLSNASLRDAELGSAQLGALSGLFNVGSGTTNYQPFLTALKAGDAAGVQAVFAANSHTLMGTVTVTQSQFSATTWTVEATVPPVTYTVVQETIGGVATLDVYTPTTPAVLSNAFMVNANFGSANMIGVNCSGASIYGIGGKHTNLNTALLQAAEFSNANLGNADFSSANLAGANFDYAVLTNAKFDNAQLTTAAGGTRASFVGANMQGASFDGTVVSNVVFTNAAFGTENPNKPGTLAGVWLMSLNAAQQITVIADLDAAANTQPQSKPWHQFTLSLQSLQQLQTPGPVGKGIANQFATAGIVLTSDALLTVMAESIYWKLTDGATHYVLFQAYDSKLGQPAIGVAMGTDYTPTPQFTLPLSLQSLLRNGPVDPAVVAAFAAAGHSVTASAQIAIAQHPTEWQVIDGPPDYQVYSLWLDLSAGMTTISVRPAITNLIAAFYDASIPLSTRSTVSLLPGGGWQVSNDAENPFNPVKNYIIYDLIPNAATGMLDVYGAFIRIARLRTPTESEYFNMPCAITKMTQAQMAGPGNVCPNGDFATTNATNHLPYDQWLRARVAPRPPFCVPDPAGMTVCPR